MSDSVISSHCLNQHRNNVKSIYHFVPKINSNTITSNSVYWWSLFTRLTGKTNTEFVMNQNIVLTPYMYLNQIPMQHCKTRKENPISTYLSVPTEHLISSKWYSTQILSVWPDDKLNTWYQVHGIQPRDWVIGQMINKGNTY